MHAARVFITVSLSVVVTACSAGPGGMSNDPARTVAAGQYAATFNAARRTLRDRGFILERVDAGAGVITTQPKTTAGLATPWHREQQSASQEVEDLLQRQQRIVRITFDPDPAPASPDADRRTLAGPLTMHVGVTLQRINSPGRKLEPDAIWLSSYWWDPDLAARGMEPQYAVAFRQDAALAEQLAALIADAAAASPALP